MQTFIRTVDHALCLYCLGKAISHDDWTPGLQVRLTLDDNGNPTNPDIYFAYLNESNLIQHRIEIHLESRTDIHRGDDCPVIELNDTDGFEARKSRIFDFKKIRLQQMIKRKEKQIANNKPSSIERIMTNNERIFIDINLSAADAIPDPQTACYEQSSQSDVHIEEKAPKTPNRPPKPFPDPIQALCVKYADQRCHECACAKWSGVKAKLLALFCPEWLKRHWNDENLCDEQNKCSTFQSQVTSPPVQSEQKF